MPYDVQPKSYWGLNILIVILVGVLFAVIFIPKQIWNEEEIYREESRQRMTNLWKTEMVFRNLTGDYTELGSHAIQIVNAVYDSLTDGKDFYGEQLISLEPRSVNLIVDRVATIALFDSTIQDTAWTVYRDDIISLYNTFAVTDSTNSGQYALRVMQAVYDSVMADSGWVEEQSVTIPFEYEMGVPENYINLYDTTFVTETQIQQVVGDTSYHAAMISDQEMGIRDTVWIPKRDLEDMRGRYPDLSVFDTSITRQTRWLTETTPIRPTEEWLYDPLTGKPYIFKVSANGIHLTIESPIEGEYKEPRYYVFSLADTSHGYIEDGEASWESPAAQ
ncbi:MAG: hypothetical protein GF372_05500 [Candidatus Marinimicrobia bacterium]|nr:hypothetical protein [Candidatus Neomarinimicrobiota bacterium]